MPLTQVFVSISDPRSARHTRHDLAELLTVAVCAVLSGVDDFVDIELWAEAKIDYLGWVAFDPTNRASATDAYIRTAAGLDYAEASPIRGVRSGGGVETMTVKVSFPSQQQQQSQ